MKHSHTHTDLSYLCFLHDVPLGGDTHGRRALAKLGRCVHWQSLVVNLFNLVSLRLQTHKHLFFQTDLLELFLVAKQQVAWRPNRSRIKRLWYKFKQILF